MWKRHCSSVSGTWTALMRAKSHCTASCGSRLKREKHRGLWRSVRHTGRKRGLSMANETGTVDIQQKPTPAYLQTALASLQEQAQLRAESLEEMAQGEERRLT